MSDITIGWQFSNVQQSGVVPSRVMLWMRGARLRGEDRREEIKRYIHNANRVTVSELSRGWDITEETVRRDLDKLEELGLVTRIHGGAIWNGVVDRGGVRFFERQRHNVEAKRTIALRAASLVRGRGTIVADSSTTVLETLRFLSNEQDLTVVTNSAGIVGGIDDPRFSLISTGGIYNRNALSFQGEPALQTIHRYNVSLALLSCKALDLDRGVMDSYESEAVVKRAMVEQADEIAVLADSSKFDQAAFLKLMDLRQLSFIVTDKKPSDDWCDYCRSEDIELVY